MSGVEVSVSKGSLVFLVQGDEEGLGRFVGDLGSISSPKSSSRCGLEEMSGLVMV